MGEEKLKEFESAMETAVKWFQENCNPYQRIIIEFDCVELVGGEMSFPVVVKD